MPLNPQQKSPRDGDAVRRSERERLREAIKETDRQEQARHPKQPDPARPAGKE